LICFDEFHVSDIADAMILGRFLEQVMERGVEFVMTSNYHPDQLYPGGLQRERFLPAIELLKTRLDVVGVDNGTDYRRLKMEQVQVYHLEEAPLARIFDELKDVEEEKQPLDVEGRTIPYRKRAGGLVWFDFQALCGGPRSYADYVDLTKRFHTVMLSGVPRMSPKNADAALHHLLEETAENHRVGDVGDVEFVEADQPVAPGGAHGHLGDRVLGALELVELAMDLAHEVVEVHAALAHQRHAQVERVHQKALAAAHGSPQVHAFRQRRLHDQALERRVAPLLVRGPLLVEALQPLDRAPLRRVRDEAPFLQTLLVERNDILHRGRDCIRYTFGRCRAPLPRS
jgi:hypothetical protein